AAIWPWPAAPWREAGASSKPWANASPSLIRSAASRRKPPAPSRFLPPQNSAFLSAPRTPSREPSLASALPVGFPPSVGAAGAAVSIAASPGPLTRTVLGANDRIGVGLIGAGGMGQFDLRDFLRSGQVDAIAIADPFQPNLDRALELTDGKAKGFKDFRAVL